MALFGSWKIAWPAGRCMRCGLAAALFVAVLLSQWPPAEVVAEAQAAGAASLDCRDVSTRDNAAIKYWRAFALTSQESKGRIGTASFSIDSYSVELDGIASPESAEMLLRDCEDVIAMLLDASKLPACDFAADWHKGIGMLLPELAEMRRGARLLLLSAAYELTQGNTAAAAERVAAAFSMSRHVAESPVLIGALVGVALFRVTQELALEALNTGLWTEADRATIAQSLALFPNDDPFRVCEALQNEERWIGGWMQGRVTREWSTPAGFLEEMRIIGVGLLPADQQPVATGEWTPAPAEPDDDPDRALIKALINAKDFQAALTRDIVLYRQAIVLCVASWDAPNAPDQLEQISVMLEENQFGFLAKVMMPSFTRSWKQDMQARQTLQELKEAFD